MCQWLANPYRRCAISFFSMDPFSKLRHLAVASGPGGHVSRRLKPKSYAWVRLPRSWAVGEAYGGPRSSISRILLSDYTFLIAFNRSKVNLHDWWQVERGESIHSGREIWLVAISLGQSMPLVQLKFWCILLWFIQVLKHNWRLFCTLDWLQWGKYCWSYTTSRLMRFFKPHWAVHRAPMWINVTFIC